MVRHFIFSDRSSLGFLFRKWLDWVLEFPGLAYIFHSNKNVTVLEILTDLFTAHIAASLTNDCRSAPTKPGVLIAINS